MAQVFLKASSLHILALPVKRISLLMAGLFDLYSNNVTYEASNHLSRIGFAKVNLIEKWFLEKIILMYIKIFLWPRG
ncbi:hypothetical protein A1E_03485 [Rickettsia canadensis str. McKiel]|uniref:Uncharacterized protein n=1 Tax=Rickettsia canadensis (strain McKiel) TaxID=293613 RepID=A8EZ49_RICCK|nr:hypothetical protein A1E_03485 [Rickettsia canadensis str. McKiel]